MSESLKASAAQEHVFQEIDSRLKEFESELLSRAKGRRNLAGTARVELSRFIAEAIVTIALEVQAGNIKG